MSLRKITVVALAGIVAMGLAAGVAAQDVSPGIEALAPEEKVDMRQNIMRQNGGTMRNIGSMSAADASAAADTLIQNFTDLPVLFAEGTIVGDSEALPLIWEEKDAFDAIFAQAREAAVAIKAAAEAGDAAGIAAGAGTIGPLCGQCHNRYRS